MANAGLVEILGGAVTDRQFRTLLVRNPRAVLSSFDLTVEEREAVAGIRANTFEDFAAQLYAWMVGQGNGYGSVRGHDEPRLSQFRPIAVNSFAPALTS
jgi:hypothetical protein